MLVTGNNFGCGSSREHAPQSLMRAGVRAVVAGSFAEIFAGNCTNLGMACLTADAPTRAALVDWIRANPGGPLTVDLDALTAAAGGETFAVTMAADAREALLTGRYDFLAQLLEAQDEVAATAAGLPYLTGFAA